MPKQPHKNGTAPIPKHELQPGTKVKILRTVHSHVSQGMTGTIQGWEPGGYAVHFENAIKFQAERGESVTFMGFGEVEPV